MSRIYPAACTRISSPIDVETLHDGLYAQNPTTGRVALYRPAPGDPSTPQLRATGTTPLAQLHQVGMGAGPWTIDVDPGDGRPLERWVLQRGLACCGGGPLRGFDPTV